MFNYLRLSYNLLRLANSVLDRRKGKFKKELEGLDLNEKVLEETLDCLIDIKDHLVRKMSIHWLKKGTVILPDDLPKVEQAHKLAKDNRGIDYLKFESPVEIIEQFEEKAKIEFDKLIKPDSLPELYNKVDLGEGVTIYTVEDSKEGQYAVRKLADFHFGPGFDKWCITGRYPSLYPDAERDDMGMMLESFEYWKNRYNKYPKRVAFKDGKLFAFCGSDIKQIVWWDKGNNDFEYIPKHKHLGDDHNFIDKYIYEKGDHFETDIKRMTALDIKRALLSDTVSDDFKLQIIDKANIDTKVSVAKNPNTLAEVLVKLSNDEDGDVCSYVAKNPNTPVEVLVELSENESIWVRESIAKNPNTPVEVLVKLSKDEDYNVRESIAKNPNMADEALIELSNDKDVLIRRFVARNPNTPADILAKMSSDKDGNVRFFVAANPNTPVEVLIKLSNDKDWKVSESAVKNSNFPVDILIELSSDEVFNVRSFVAQNPKAPESVLIKLSEDEHENVRQSVAFNSKTPVDVLVKLSEDEDWLVRASVAGNSSTPEDVLIKLSSDESEYVRQSVAGNSNMPVDVLVEMSSDSKSNVRYSVAKNSNTPAEVLAKLSYDESYLVRCGVAENTRVLDDVLNKLSSDRNYIVVYFAKENLRSRGYDV